MITNIFLSAPSRYEAMIANVMVTDVTIYWQLQTIVLSSKDKKSKKNKKKEKEKDASVQLNSNYAELPSFERSPSVRQAISFCPVAY